MKKIYSLALLLGLTPGLAAAEVTDVATAAEFEAAIADLKTEIRLTADITSATTGAILVDNGLTLDLNGHALTLAGTLAHRGTETFTVTDNSTEQNGSITSTTTVLSANTTGPIVVKAGTIYGEGIEGTVGIGKYGSVTLEGGVIKSPRRGRAVTNRGLLYIKGGTIIGADHGLEPVYNECGEVDFPCGVTEMTGGAVYAGNMTPSPCFDNSYWTDGTDVEEGKAILPEGVHDGGAIVLDEKWAIPGTYYVNYHIPAGAEVQPNFTHYYTPGEAIALPECNYRDNVPYAGWATSADDTENMIKEIPADAAGNYQLYPVWKYVGFPDAVTLDFTTDNITPEPGSQVESITTITLAYGEDVTAELKDGVEDFGYIVNTTTGEQVSKLTITTGGWDGNVYITAETPVTANGTYMVFVPAGTFGNEDWYYDDYEDGRCNPDLRYTYKIHNRPTGTTPTEVDPADGSTVTALSTVTITFPGETDVIDNYIDTKITVTDADGNVVSELDAGMVENGQADNVMVLTLPEPIVKAGVYTMSIPEGFFSFDWWERDCSALTYTWTVEPEDGIGAVEADAAAAEYYTLDGVRIARPEAGQIVIMRRGTTVGKIIIR